MLRIVELSDSSGESDNETQIKELKTTPQVEIHNLLSENHNSDEDEGPLIKEIKSTKLENKSQASKLSVPSIQEIKPTKRQVDTDSEYNSVLDELRSRPESPDRFVTILKQILNDKTKYTYAQYFSLVVTVLNTNVYDFFTQLTSQQSQIVVEFLTTPIAISNILIQLKSLISNFDTQNDSSKSTSKTNPVLLLRDPQVQKEYIKSTNPISQKDLKPVDTKITTVSEIMTQSFKSATLLLSILSLVLRQSTAVIKLFQQTAFKDSTTNKFKRTAELKELNAFLAGSRIHSMASQCLLIFEKHPLVTEMMEDEESNQWKWMADTLQYSEFLSYSISQLLNRNKDTPGFVDSSAMIDFFTKSLKLHPSSSESILHHIIEPLHIENETSLLNLLISQVLQHMKSGDFKTCIINSLVPYLNKKYLFELALNETIPASNETLDEEFLKHEKENRLIISRKIQSCSMLLNYVIVQSSQTETALKLLISELLELSTNASSNLPLRRFIILSIHNLIATSISDADFEQTVFIEYLQSWGKLLNVRHSQIMTQQYQTEVLLLWACQLNKLKQKNARGESPIQAVEHSGAFLNGVSNHLSSQTIRPRIFGVAVAEVFHSMAISHSTKSDDKPLDFGMDDIYGEDLDYFRKYLVSLRDGENKIDIKELNDILHTAPNFHLSKPKKTKTIATTKPKSNKKQYNVEDETVEFKPYTFEDEVVNISDSDSEDLDDPSISVLNKERKALKPPVYLKDLADYLSSTENYDKQKLALDHGVELIQKKWKFGSEIKVYGKEVASSLIGMSDKYNIKNFNTNREEMLNMLVAADPLQLAPFLAQLLVVGDYSMYQRAIILSTLASSARLLANFGGPVDNTTKSSSSAVAMFPTKMLPNEAMHQAFLKSANQTPRSINGNDDNKQQQLSFYNNLKALTYGLQRELVGETASKAKEELLSQNKVLRVSQTLQRQRDNKTPVSRSKTNVYAQICYKSYFTPLVGQWYRIISNGSNAKSKFLKGKAGGNVYSELFVGQFLNTLSILLFLAAPTCPQLNEMCGTLLELLMGLRGATTTTTTSFKNKKSQNDNGDDDNDQNDITFRESIYTALLAILQVCNEQDGYEMLVRRWPKPIIEMKMWADEMWLNHEQFIPTDNSSSPVDEESRRVRGLAANVLFMFQGLTEKWKQRMIGELTGLENDASGDNLVAGSENVINKGFQFGGLGLSNIKTSTSSAAGNITIPKF